MAIHNFGEYLDFHPHLHALIADGLFTQGGLCHVTPEASFAPLEKLFRARLITFLVKERLLPPERANLLPSLKHSGFNIRRSRRVPPGSREVMERLAHYIIRNTLLVMSMH